MKVDYKLQHEAFDKMSFQEKQDHTTTLLSTIKNGNPLFESIYDLIRSPLAIEQDFNDVFYSIITVLYREEKHEEHLAITKLQEIRNHLEMRKKTEKKEKNIEQQESERLLAQF